MVCKSVRVSEPQISSVVNGFRLAEPSVLFALCV